MSSVPRDPTSKLRETQRKADETAAVARQNIQMSIAQVDRLEDMEDKAADLESGASSFNRAAVATRRHFCWQYWKMNLLIFVLVAVLIIILAAVLSKK